MQIGAENKLFTELEAIAFQMQIDQSESVRYSRQGTTDERILFVLLVLRVETSRRNISI